MRIGILTGGGDAPGLNDVIRSFTVRATQLGHEVVGVRRGWKGVIDKDARTLKPADVASIGGTGGTILLTSRTNPAKDDATLERAVHGYKALKLDGLVALGGNDTLTALSRLAERGIQGIGVPKTIDNDLLGTDVTFGYDTAVARAAEAIENLHTTARSHERCLVVEVMGRDAGWITLASGLAGGAHVILLPEEPFDLDEVLEVVRKRDREGHGYTIVAVSEGARPKKEATLAGKSEALDEFGNVRLGGIGERLAKRIEALAGKESRHVVLGHLQRAGPPTAFDRVLATRLGVAAAEAADAKEFGVMLAVKGTEIVPVPIAQVAKGIRTVPPELVRLARIFRGG